MKEARGTGLKTTPSATQHIPASVATGHLEWSLSETLSIPEIRPQ